MAERLGVPERLRANAPDGVGQSASALVETERVLASVTEAVIGACYLHNGYETTAAAVVEAFQPEIEQALEHPVDFKSTLQERLAQRGAVVAYDVTAEHGPAARPHLRGARDGRGRGGRARQRPLQEGTPSRRPRAARWRTCWLTRTTTEEEES